MILCHNCKKQECQDIVLYIFNSLISSTNSISVNVALLQIKGHLVIIIYIYSTYLYRNKTLNPRVNDEGFINPEFRQYIYPAREIKFMSD